MKYEQPEGNEYCPLDDSTAGQSTGLENTTQKTNPHHTAPGDRTHLLQPTEQFSAKTPKHHTTRYDEIIVADDDAILFELESPPSGDPDV